MEIERLREPCPKWAANEIDHLRAELAAAQTIATRERAEADVQIERRIEVEAELAARDARIASLGRRCTTSEAAHSDTIDDLNRLRAVTATANARIAELEELRVTETRKWAAAEARAERAEAERDALREALKYLLSELPDQLDDMRSAVLARAALAPSPAKTFRVPALTPDQKAHLNTLEPQPYDPDTMIGAPSPAGPDGKSLAVLYCVERAEEDVKLLRKALEGMIAVAEGRFDGNPHADIDALAKARAALNRSPAGREG